MRGRFITFEGGEGAGKSTQAALLAQRLKALAIPVVLTREPGGSAGAEIIRHILLNGGAKPFGPDAEAVLFAAARADHVTNTIRPALERGDWVICDRFIDSTRVYQGAVGQVDARIISALERLTVGDTVPDLTFLLDLPPRVGLERASARRGAEEADRFEQEAPDFHATLRRAYKAIAAADPERCVTIDARRAQDAVAIEVWTVVQARLNPTAQARALSEAAP
ncbi:MAG TPA: dTMP kinase [Xanthobacteraceae bacterium]|jgi:dTMP kinase|nr:dTMP kinase [Xanthobacteraceae bacterium]